MRSVALLLLLSVSAAAQHRETIAVNVVDVPVFVERNGHPVAGLTKDDFELFVNGAPQAIDYFDVIEETALKTETAAAVPLNRRRLFVLLFDVAESSAPSLFTGRKMASELVANAGPNDVFAVATVGRSGGVTFQVPFTSDRVAVQRAVGTLKTSESKDPFALALLPGERATWTASASGAPALADLNDIRTPVGRSAQRFEALQRETEAMRLSEQLEALAGRLAPLIGIKHVVLFSEREAPRTVSVSQAATRMAERFRAAGAILSAVDIGTAARAEERTGAGALSLAAPDILYTLALGTGGTVAPSIKVFRELQSVTYVLGFVPRGAQKKRNDIRVRLRDQSLGTTVRHRREYTLDGGEGKRDDGLFLADVLMNDIPQRDFTIALMVQPSAGGAKVVATIPGKELLAIAAEKFSLDAYVYVFDEKNVVAKWQEKKLNIDMKKGRAFLEQNALPIEASFELPPGRYAAKVLVRGGELTGFGRIDFSVPGTNVSAGTIR